MSFMGLVEKGVHSRINSYRFVIFIPVTCLGFAVWGEVVVFVIYQFTL